MVQPETHPPLELMPDLPVSILVAYNGDMAINTVEFSWGLPHGTGFPWNTPKWPAWDRPVLLLSQAVIRGNTAIEEVTDDLIEVGWEVVREPDSGKDYDWVCLAMPHGQCRPEIKEWWDEHGPSEEE